MKNFKNMKAKVMALVLAVSMAMSNVTAFAASYSFTFDSIYSGDNTKYCSTGVTTTSTYRDSVTQDTSASYNTYYYLVTKPSASGTVATSAVTLKNRGTGYFNYKSGYGGNGQTYYLKGVAEEYTGRPGYTVKGTFLL